mmetsp:Transcript_71423/g.136222  ORF Transcript_71423/g.136222 Transcript_71423/m.136222 type:complete len:279 (-) Transcript_71423:45-881(-)
MLRPTLAHTFSLLALCSLVRSHQSHKAAGDEEPAAQERLVRREVKVGRHGGLSEKQGWDPFGSIFGDDDDEEEKPAEPDPTPPPVSEEPAEETDNKTEVTPAPTIRGDRTRIDFYCKAVASCCSGTCGADLGTEYLVTQENGFSKDKDTACAKFYLLRDDVQQDACKGMSRDHVMLKCTNDTDCRDKCAATCADGTHRGADWFSFGSVHCDYFWHNQSGPLGDADCFMGQTSCLDVPLSSDSTMYTRGPYKLYTMQHCQGCGECPNTCTPSHFYCGQW